MFGSDFDDFRHHGHGNAFERHPRLFKRGDMKYVILDLLKDKPSHGYELTTALEDRFHGLYSPSAGSVYPVLQLLEDMGYVTYTRGDGKKVYTITDTGKKFLEDQKETTEKIGERLRGWWGSDARERLQEMRQFRGLVRDLFHQVGRVASRRDAAKTALLNRILSNAIKEIENIE